MRTPPVTRGVWLSLVLVMGPHAAIAGEPRLEVQLRPSRFGVEDTARIEIRIVEPPEGLEQPELGELSNLQVVGGPSRGTEFSFINGVATSAVTFTFLVRAEGPGAATVGPITVVAGELELRTEPVTAEVVPGSVMPPRRGWSPFINDPFESLMSRRRAVPAQLVLRHLVAADQVVVGEPVMATVVLDTNVGISDFDWLAAPSYPGWWASRVEPPERIPPEVVEVDGTTFSRFTIARHALLPLKAGVLVVPPVRARVGVGSRSLLEPGEVLERATGEIEVRVGERPRPPAGYAGAVGQLSYSAELNPAEIEFGASAVLEVRLEGSGNLPLVEAPTVWPVCPECETYPPEEESRITVDDEGIHGSRTWRVTVVPRTWGRMVLTPVEMAVLDPGSGTYRRQTVGPLTLVVAPPPPTPTPAVEVAAEPAAVPGAGAGSPAGDAGRPTWLWLVAALVAGTLIGGIAVWAVSRRRTVVIPPPRPDQTPAERARELQVALERWWLDVRAGRHGPGLEGEMERLRRDLETVRFAPGRADHSETVVDLERRFRSLLRRA